jgi:hypothetical protein
LHAPTQGELLLTYLSIYRASLSYQNLIMTESGY